MEVERGSDQTLDLYPHLTRQNGRLKEADVQME